METGEIRRIDLIGFLCPIPVHETRRVLKDCVEGELIEVVCDDPETLHDIPALCDRMGVILEKVEEEDGEFRFLIAKGTGELGQSPSPPTLDNCSTVCCRSIPHFRLVPKNRGRQRRLPPTILETAPTSAVARRRDLKADPPAHRWWPSTFPTR